MGRRAWVLFLFLLVSFASSALAQERAEPPPEAVELFLQGRAEYEAGRYAEAAALLENALTLDPGSPTLIFNLTRVYELQGDLTSAIVHGRNYLELVDPANTAEREEAELTLRRLEGARDFLARREQAQQGHVEELRTLAPEVVIRERGVADAAFWATLATGGALLVGGAISGGMALSSQSDVDEFVLETQTGIEDRNELQKQADTRALVADILLGAGAAVTTGALLLFLLRTRSYRGQSEDATAHVRFLGTGLRLEGTF